MLGVVLSSSKGEERAYPVYVSDEQRRPPGWIGAQNWQGNSFPSPLHRYPASRFLTASLTARPSTERPAKAAVTAFMTLPMSLGLTAAVS
jgi:hypothetical protein